MTMKKRGVKNKKNILRLNGRMLAITIFFAVMALLSAIWFSGNYYGLNGAIQNERVESVGQIGMIILEKIQLQSESYAAQLEQAANLLMASEVTTMEQVKQNLGNAKDICLLGADGSCYNLCGDPIYFLDIQSIYKNLSQDETISQFGSIRAQGDFWVFTTPLSGITLDGLDMVGMLKLIDEETYSNTITNTIFGNQGATYVVSASGVILLRPENTENNHFFASYNMLSYMEMEQVEEEQIEQLRTALLEQISTQVVVTMHENLWLIQTLPDTQGRNIVLTVPISITAKETFSYMQKCILSMIALITSLAAILIFWIYYLVHRAGQLKLEQAKAVSRSDFMGKVSHDIRTPLNAIIGMIEVAQRSVDNQEMLGDCLDSAKKASEYLVEVINDVLDISRIENGKLSIVRVSFSLQDLLENIRKMETPPAKQKGLQLILEDETEKGIIRVADDIRVKQCLMNLVSNAIKFTPSGGVVTLRCEEEPKEGNKRQVRFIVKDTGIGMSEEFMQHMFEPFEQEHRFSGKSGAVGSGLGLSIVHQLTTLMEGSIRVESKQGQGSLFELTIPMEIAEDVSKENAETTVCERTKGNRLEGRKILLAEDNEINRSIAKFILEDLGVLVEEAENGQVAVDKFCASTPGEYDFILMDIRMPLLNGLEATKVIRESEHPQAQTIPIIALSANAFQEDIQKSKGAGMQEHLPKPIDSEELEQTLCKYIGGNEG